VSTTELVNRKTPKIMVKYMNIKKLGRCVIFIRRYTLPIPVAVRSKAWVGGRSFVGIAGSKSDA
jgi:hypothetical protein